MPVCPSSLVFFACGFSSWCCRECVFSDLQHDYGLHAQPEPGACLTCFSVRHECGSRSIERRPPPPPPPPCVRLVRLRSSNIGNMAPLRRLPGTPAAPVYAHQGERSSSESHLGLYGRGSVGNEKCCAQLDCGMQRRLLLEDARQQSELMWFPRVDDWRACANLMNSSQGIAPGRGGVWVR